MHVVATAGHVDHGKSTLVRALTGMEPDRFAEERRRGMTIDLGFAWTDLPTGQTVAFVDVPGHHRFIANMLAGVGPVPAVLVVVAADEGWRRQSAEHLAALDALGVRRGLLVVTRSDLADPAPATEQALSEIAATSLGDVPSVAVSGATGAGLDALRAALGQLVESLPPADPDARLRLWVDRAFPVRGSGTVVTGTLGAGRLAVGDELELGGRRVRVRGLESLKRRHEAVEPVARVAVNLRGVEVGQVSRGDVLLRPGQWRHTEAIDVALTADPADLPRQLVLHVGSAGVSVRVRGLGSSGARLLLDRALPLEPGDRALLRDPGEQHVAAGVVVRDVDPPDLRRRGAAVARGAELTASPDPVREVSRRGSVTRVELAALGVLPLEAPPPEGVVVLGDRLVAADRWSAWAAALGAAVDAHAVAHPLAPAAPLEQARRAAGLPDLAVLAALVAADDRLETAEGRVRRPGVLPRFDPPVQAALDALVARLTAAAFDAPEQAELTGAGLVPEVLAAAQSAGLVLRLSDGVVVLPGDPARAMRVLAGLSQPFTTSAARQALGVSRRIAIPLLEHLDGRGWTRRVTPSERVVVR